MKKEKQKTAIVLGVARSGTSVTTGVLHCLGFDMGRDHEIITINPKGSFEDKDFRNLINNQIIKSAKNRKKFYPYDYWINPPTINEIKSVLPKYDRQIKELIKKKSKNKILWGWKSPSTHLIIDPFIKYINNPFFIVVVRNPLDILKSAKISFRKFSSLSNDIQKLAVINYHTKIIRDVLKKHHKVPCFYISYENLVKNPIKVSKKLANFLNIKLDNNKIKQINRFVIPRNNIKKERFKRIFYNHFAYMFKRHSRALQIILKNLNNPKRIKKEIVGIINLYKNKYGNLWKQITKTFSIIKM